MNILPLDRVARLANADSVSEVEFVQSLWSGYGQIVRVRLSDANSSSVANLTIANASDVRPLLPATAIVKHVCPPERRGHKYGWTGDVSHQRKLRSYENETNWYRNASKLCNDDCRVPRLIGAETERVKAGWLLVMEDLDAAGFRLRHRSVTDAQVDSCLGWLANFHATFMVDTSDENSVKPAEAHQLWPIGTYWHLGTRPDELTAMEDGALKRAATAINTTLNEARYQTLVHGDAKLANFCFGEEDQIAAVDFQYVGGGCGIKDVAYFVSSCFSDEECERREQALLDNYFKQLETALSNRQQETPITFANLETEWRKLYPVAWADFYRFLAGWSPGHWKMHGYSERVTQEVLNQLS